MNFMKFFKEGKVTPQILFMDHKEFNWQICIENQSFKQNLPMLNHLNFTPANSTPANSTGISFPLRCRVSGGRLYYALLTLYA